MYELCDLFLEHDHTYKVWVDAYNGAGRMSSTPTSTVYVDLSPPNNTLVRVHDEADNDMTTLFDDIDLYGWAGGHHGSPVHLHTRPQAITCSWTGFFEEDATDIVGYQWAISSSEVHWGGSSDAEKTDDWPHWSKEPHFSGEPHESDDDEHLQRAGLHRWDHGPNEADIMGWSDRTKETVVAVTNFTVLDWLQTNVVYRCLVVAINSAGLTSHYVASDGFTWDDTHAVDGTVIDSLNHLEHGHWWSEDFGDDWDYSPEDQSLRIMWAGFNDPQYRLREYEAGMGPCDEWETIPLLKMGLATSHNFSRIEDSPGSCTWESVTTSTACRLPHNSTYCGVVRVENEHHLWGPRRRTDGVRVCTLGPIAGVVRQG